MTNLHILQSFVTIIENITQGRGMRVVIEKLDKGFFVEVFKGSQSIAKFSATGKWNMYPLLGKYLFGEEPKPLGRPKKEKSKKRAL